MELASPLGFNVQSIAVGSGFGILFYLSIFIFVLYSLLLAYHWYAYGTKRSISNLALAVYLVVSCIFIASMSISLFYT